MTKTSEQVVMAHVCSFEFLNKFIGWMKTEVRASLVYTVIILLFCIMNGCSKNSVTEYKYCLKNSGTKEFVLYEGASPFSRTVAYYENSEGTYYIHFDMVRSEFLFYDYSTGNLLKKCAFDNLPVPDAAAFINYDSIIYIYDGSKNVVVIADTSKKVISRIDTRADYLNPKEISVNCKNYAPVLFRNNKLFYVNMRVAGTSEGKRRDVCLGGFLDLSMGEKNNFVYYPDIYFKNSYGHLNFNVIYSCFSKNAMVVSFPASGYLFRYDLNTTKVDSIRCSSDYFKKIKPLKKNINLKGFNEEESIRYYASNPSYSVIHYDKYRKVYYRFTELPNKRSDFNPNDDSRSIMKSSTVIILDEKFNKIGETFIGKGYNILGIIISPDGLLISRLDEKEPKIVYYIFKLLKNE